MAPVASAQEPYHPSLGGDRIEVRFGIFKLTTEAVVSSTRSGRPTFELDLGSLGMEEDVEVPFVSAKFPLGCNRRCKDTICAACRRREFSTFQDVREVVCKNPKHARA